MIPKTYKIFNFKAYMEWKTHISLGILFGLIAYILLSRKFFAEINLIDFLIWTSFFSIAPDFDIIFKHRSEYTHSLLGVFLGFIIGFILKRNLLWAFIAASSLLSHVFADSLTSSGVPLFYPFSKRKHVHFPYIGGRTRYDNKYANRTIQMVGLFLILAILAYGVYRGDVESTFIKRLIDYLTL